MYSKDAISCKRRFNHEFKALLGNENLRCIALFLRAFHLEGFYEAHYVLHEVYLRGHKQLDQGRSIRKLGPWMRSTAYNIVRELSREHKKQIHFNESTLSSPHDNDPIPEEGHQKKLDRAGSAFQKLQLKDREILSLSVLDGLSTEDIRQQLINQGEDLNSATVRKRKQRALERLRRNYHGLEHPEITTKI